MALVAHREHRFKDGAFAILNPLAHRVKVGGKVDRRRENTQVVFALAFAIELFPPFCKVVQTRAEVHQNFNLLAALIERIASLSVGEHIFVIIVFNFHSASHQSLDIETRHCNPTGVSTEKRPPTLSGIT